WVGNSMGGVIGYEILKVAPEKIEMIITNGTTPELKMSKWTAKLICFFDKLLIKLMKFDGYIRFASKHSSKIKSAQEEIYSVFKKASPKAIIDSHYMLANYSYIDLINKTDVPVIIIKAQYDKEINKHIKKISEALQKNKNVKFIEFANVGHIANLEKPKEYNQILEKLINSELNM
ncbi:MAG: alpha/beta hydrolase, partial [Tenericutes bacterium]|nr:alpha/beta hydrolase [Mycoplasmatota bacterium]